MERVCHKKKYADLTAVAGNLMSNQELFFPLGSQNNQGDQPHVNILTIHCPQISYHLGWQWAPLVVHFLQSVTLIHLSARMTPSSLHAFWSSSCHTLALQSLPRSSSLASSSQSLTHDLSSPSESTLVSSGAPLICRNQPTVLANRVSVSPAFTVVLKRGFGEEHLHPVCGQN